MFLIGTLTARVYQELFDKMFNGRSIF